MIWVIGTLILVFVLAGVIFWGVLLALSADLTESDYCECKACRYGRWHSGYDE
jgi:nitrate/TMAO reductase-like tetraheme cytochrome c subunit